MLRDVFVDAVRVMKPLLDRRHQALIFNEPDQLKPIIIDPTRLTQVLVNLLSNASKYSPFGEEIEVSLELNGSSELKGAVLDRGPGISEADREYLFKRFVRLEAQSEAQYGIGLGLSVVKTIIEEHGGEMGVNAREGKGSIFWFTIPVDQEKT
jgi:signal transduction histidine kinase